ncbi:MAG TPA: hypothetical protein VF173_02675 [Thermoanaerobaculia bacterium]|nr:hypothetical protein [Thermoanaerobaculia bacterium]
MNDKDMSIPEADCATPESGDPTEFPGSLPVSPAQLHVHVKEMPKNKSSWFLSFAALCISALSLVVAVFGVVSQSRTGALSAMPALSLYPRWELTKQEKTSEPQIATLMWKIENTGLGPAIVSASELYIPSTRQHYSMGDQNAWPALEEALSKHFKLKKLPIAGFNYDPVVPGYAVRPGGEWPLFQVSLRGVPVESLHPALEAAIVAVCYCSLHGECFYQDSQDPSKRHPLFACSERQNIQTLIRQSGIK